MLGTIRCAGAILDLFTTDHPTWRLRDIAKTLGHAPSTVHSVVSSMVDAGLLMSRSRGLYEVNWYMLRLASLVERDQDVIAAGAPVLSRLSDTIEASVQLVVLRRWLVQCVHSQPYHGAFRIALPSVGESFPAYSSAAGKVLLGTREHSQIRKLSRVILSPAGSQGHHVDEQLLMNELTEVRDRGFSVDQGAYLDGVCCVAAPVGNAVMSGVAAVVAVVPLCRFVRAKIEFERAVVAAAEELSDCLRSDTQIDQQSLRLSI